ncbi:MAG TPA: aspartate kinase [Saprospiraceae bacterium]|nr:aspartate kinase [Saprospiraceae bacterium]
MALKVFKFGGASVQDATNIKNVCSILKNHSNEQLVVVISAMGKMTNALEEVVNAYYYENGNAYEKLENVRKFHYDIISALSFEEADLAYSEVNDHLVEIEWILEEPVQDSYDYVYDQIVSIGELMSTKIIAHYLKSENVNAMWLDARDCIWTDDTYREGRVDWEMTKTRLKSKIDPILNDSNVIVTQGFIASDSANNNVTLGREGSDYTAAIFSYCLDAESMHIWKDVPGILTADPQCFDYTTKIERLSYQEAIEMTYFGAKVIHPKTIKPLQNKNIPLYVRPFNDESSLGTCISDVDELSYPPIIVLEQNQAIINISTKDFSFIAEHHLSEIFDTLNRHRVKVNMMRNAAISFSLCVIHDSHKVNAFLEALKQDYVTDVITGLELITIRHFNQSTIVEMKRDKIILFEELLHNTIRLVVKINTTLKRKSLDI